MVDSPFSVLRLIVCCIDVCWSSSLEIRGMDLWERTLQSHSPFSSFDWAGSLWYHYHNRLWKVPWYQQPSCKEMENKAYLFCSSVDLGPFSPNNFTIHKCYDVLYRQRKFDTMWWNMGERLERAWQEFHCLYTVLTSWMFRYSIDHYWSVARKDHLHSSAPCSSTSGRTNAPTNEEAMKERHSCNQTVSVCCYCICDLCSTESFRFIDPDHVSPLRKRHHHRFVHHIYSVSFSLCRQPNHLLHCRW